MPSCGAQNLFRLGAPTNFDRCAILASLLHPPGALRRRCPARACLGKDYVLPKQKDTVKVSFLFWQGQKDLVSPAGSVGASKHLRCLEVSTGHPHPSTRSACRAFKPIFTNEKEKAPTVSVLSLFGRGRRT